MANGLGASDAPPGGTLDHTLADEIGLDDVFDGRSFFARGGRDGIESDWTAICLFNNVGEDSAVSGVKATVIDLEQVKGAVDNIVGEVCLIELR